MHGRDQQRAHVLARLIGGELRFEEAVVLLGLSARQVWRLKAAFLREGPAALVHGNRGRTSARRTDAAVRARVLALARTRYDGANDCHLTELLADHEGIVLDRATVRRILRAAGRASPRRRRAPRYRSRRERMPQAGLLLQLDGSRHDWLEGRGPWLTLLGAIDDATGVVTAATFRDAEDAAGYFELLRETVRRYGVPAAVYHDRHGVFETAPRERAHEAWPGPVAPTQLGRALAELGIASIAAASPQAKGRVERLWGTFQDRLVTELRLARVVDRAGANRLLGRFVARYNRRFAVAPALAEPAWRPLPAGLDLETVLAFRYERVVANDHTIRIAGLVLDLPRVGGRGYAGRRVTVSIRHDGRFIVTDRDRCLLVTRPLLDAGRLRSLETARPIVDELAAGNRPSAGYPPAAGHPWRQVDPHSKLGAIIEAEHRLTESVPR